LAPAPLPTPRVLAISRVVTTEADAAEHPVSVSHRCSSSATMQEPSEKVTR
jgi:hypothetical protein